MNRERHGKFALVAVSLIFVSIIACFELDVDSRKMKEMLRKGQRFRLRESK